MPPVPPILAPDLDPKDWPALRAQAHRMLDDMLDHIQSAGEGPVWRPAPPSVREAFAASLPRAPQALEAVHEDFLRTVLPYGVGNTHPRFFGWVHGGGNVVGALAEMLAAGLNANLGGRDHMPVEVERQVARWMAELFDFPAGAGGLFVTGASMANLIAVLIARARALGPDSRRLGVGPAGARLRAYASCLAHSCIAKAMDMAGLGSDALRGVAVDAEGRMDIAALKAAVAQDRAAGLEPFLVVGTAGGVDTGAVDDLAALAQVARDERLWLHVDGAFGALARLSPELAPLLDGIEQADSIAFDFHKTGQRPMTQGSFWRATAPGSGRLRFHRGLSAPRGQGAGGGSPLAVRFRARPVARISRLEGMVRFQDLRGGRHRRLHPQHLPPGRLSGRLHRRRAGAGASGARAVECRVFSLSRADGKRPAEWRHCGTAAGLRRGAP